MIDSVSIDVSQVDQKTDAQVRSRSAAGGERQNNFASDGAFAQMNNARTDLGEEIEQSVRADCAQRRYAQSEDENWEQQYTAPDSRHSDEGPDYETHQALDQQIHDNTGCSPLIREALARVFRLTAPLFQ